MLDLTQRKAGAYPIKWTNGKVYNLKMPTQALLKDMLTIDSIEDVGAQIDAVYEIIRKIMNNNTEKKTFAKEEISKLDVDTCQLILTDYMDKTTESLGE